MRALPALVLMLLLAAGCTPYIPVKDDFGTSAAVPVGAVPPEFAAFNNYNAATNALLADQMCATAYQPLSAKTLAAAPGAIIEARGRCETHVPLFGD